MWLRPGWVSRRSGSARVRPLSPGPVEAIGCYGKEADTPVAHRSTCADRKVRPPPPPPPPPSELALGPHVRFRGAVLPPARSMFASSAISVSQVPDRRTLHTQAHGPVYASGCVHTGIHAGTYKSPVHQIHRDLIPLPFRVPLWLLPTPAPSEAKSKRSASL